MNQHLARYLARERITQRAFAERLGVRAATVTAWMQGGTPRPDMMARIERETGGAVLVSSWFYAAPDGDGGGASDQAERRSPKGRAA